MSTFKKGDYVVFNNLNYPTYHGKRYTVVSSLGDGTSVKSGGKQYHFYTSNLTLVRPESEPEKTALPTDSAKRKEFPLFSGLLAYFPAALAQVSNHSYIGNEKHNPGLPMQHARGRSGDHEDCIIRHLIDAKERSAGSNERIEELRGVAWRALALLQEECELSFAPPAPAATFDRSTK